MTRQKIGSEYWRSGYGRGIRKANIYLINGFAYAKDATTANTAFNKLTGELTGYVTVNAHKNTSTGEVLFFQCSDHSHHDKHLPYLQP